MAEKAGLQVTKKYIVNQGQPYEAVYDDISNPTRIDEENAYYIANWRGKDGIIDQNGLAVLPFQYSKISEIVVDRKQGNFAICKAEEDYFGETRMRTRVVWIDNPEICSEAYESVKSTQNRDGDLFFQTYDGRYGLIRFHKHDGQFKEIIKDVCKEVFLDRAYNLAALSYASGLTDIVINPNGKIVYRKARDGWGGGIERLDQAENAFIVDDVYFVKDGEKRWPHTRKELLVVTDDEALIKKIPDEIWPKSKDPEKWSEFLEKEFSDQIIW